MDIYFNTEYAKLNESIEHGQMEVFEYTCQYGTVKNVFIKRKIPVILEGVQYYDAITPYGYGGPLVIEASDREKLLLEYELKYKKFCKEEGIVDEFVRFHPLMENAKDFQGVYQNAICRQTVAIDMQDENFYMVQFTSECRNRIKNASKRGVTIEIDEKCNRIDEFIELYYMTMDKNNASEYYYFGKNYFESLLSINDCQVMLINAIVEQKIIASVLYMISDGNMHYHLSANNPEYYKYAANNLIIYNACKYGNENSLKWQHLGGGLSSEPNDSLFRFKRSFGRTDRNLKDFYIGKAVFMPEVYDELCSIAKANGVENDGFFPAYRKAH